MSQVSVVQYNNNNNNNNATVAAQKVNILQQNTSTNHASSIISDRHIIVLRKPPTILPQPNKDYPKDDILITNPGRKGIKKPGKEPKTSPPPISVARRNARERNRVKQVNNGFANLRQHIPNFIAQAFESSNGRGNKKLSKVETLRMAVEYIRSLEDVLALDGYTLPKEEPRTSSDSSSLYQNENNGTSSEMGYSFVMSPSDDDDDFSSVNTASPQQYIRINTANNTFEIVPTLYGDNSENLDPMNVDGNNHHQLNLLDSELDLNSQDLTYLQVNTLQGTTNDSLSPGMYSEDSLSPNNENNCTKLSECNLPQNCFIPVFTTGRLGDNFNVEIKEELPVISIKEGEQHENIDEITNWWEQNAPQNNS